MRSHVARFYLWQSRRWNRFLRALDGAYTGLWLGLLSRRGLEDVDNLHYRRNATYNSEAHNLGGLMHWEERAIHGFFRGSTYLAVMGAGAGREVLALERRGFRVDGFECNPTLVDFARSFLPRHGAAAMVHFLDRNLAPPPAGYDGLIMGWSSYTLIAGRERRIELLRRLRMLVPEGAPLLLSFFTQPEGATRLRAAFMAARAIRWVCRRELPELGDDLMPLFVHRFTQAEIEAELQGAGFRLAFFEPEGDGKRDSGWAIGVAEPVRPDLVVAAIDMRARALS